MKSQRLRRFAAFFTTTLLAGHASVFLAPSCSFAADQDLDTFLGLQPGLGSLPLLGRGRTRSISAENPTGEKGKGGMAIPNLTEPKPAASARAADNLGQGWKVRPFIRINARQTAVLMDVAGPGIIQHIWLVEGLNRGLVIRFYWDGEVTPSVEAPVPDFFAVGHGRFAPVDSLAVVVNPANAMNCFWPMPFRTRGRITLSNETAQDVELVAYQITYVETEVPAAAGTFLRNIAVLRPPSGIPTSSSTGSRDGAATWARFWPGRRWRRAGSARGRSNSTWTVTTSSRRSAAPGRRITSWGAMVFQSRSRRLTRGRFCLPPTAPNRPISGASTAGKTLRLLVVSLIRTRIKSSLDFEQDLERAGRDRRAGVFRGQIGRGANGFRAAVLPTGTSGWRGSVRA